MLVCFCFLLEQSTLSFMPLFCIVGAPRSYHHFVRALDGVYFNLFLIFFFKCTFFSSLIFFPKGLILYSVSLELYSKRSLAERIIEKLLVVVMNYKVWGGVVAQQFICLSSKYEDRQIPCQQWVGMAAPIVLPKSPADPTSVLDGQPL